MRAVAGIRRMSIFRTILQRSQSQAVPEVEGQSVPALNSRVHDGTSSLIVFAFRVLDHLNVGMGFPLLERESSLLCRGGSHICDPEMICLLS
jgi:hypothetical protein